MRGGSVKGLFLGEGETDLGDANGSRNAVKSSELIGPLAELG